jgi:hypothetical protein
MAFSRQPKLWSVALWEVAETEERCRGKCPRNLHLKSVLLKNEAKLDQQFLQATESLLGPEIATTMH